MKMILSELERSFLQFEHTDGLNYINVEMRRLDELLALNKVQINMVSGGGIAALVPRTRTVLFDDYNRDAYHLSGFGIAPLLGINLYSLIGSLFKVSSKLDIFICQALEFLRIKEIKQVSHFSSDN